MQIKIKIRVVVLIWTALTTTFFYLSTKSMMFALNISAWSIFEIGGNGFELGFLFTPLIELTATSFNFFKPETGFNWLVKIAVGATILRWIFYWLKHWGGITHIKSRIPQLILHKMSNQY